MSNTITIIGTATDPDLNYSGKGTAYARFAVGLYEGKNDDGSYKDSSWVDVTVFGDMAERVATCVTKGDRVFVTGRITQDRWEDKESGSKRTKLKVVAEEVGLSLRFDGATATRAPRESKPTTQAATRPAPEDDPF